MTTYFNTLGKDTILTGIFKPETPVKIVKGDKLVIKVSSLNPEIDAMYNSVGAGNASVGMEYEVDQKGNIQIRKIGNLKAEDLTRKQLQDSLQSKLLPYMKDPIVIVKFLNHKVTVMGAVKSPKVLEMPEENISIIDAIVQSGDLDETAKKDKVAVIRNFEGNKKVTHLNLEDNSIFSSEYFYLQPNDIVYVEPDYTEKLKEKKKQNTQSTLAIAASGLSILITILTRIL